MLDPVFSPVFDKSSVVLCKGVLTFLKELRSVLPEDRSQPGLPHPKRRFQSRLVIAAQLAERMWDVGCSVAACRREFGKCNNVL